MRVQQQVLLFAIAAIALKAADALSLSTPEAANLAKGRLQESLSSPAKKMTISPEIIIPEPSDPTALLLQSTEVTKLSDTLRSKAKGNAAFISGSINSVKSFCDEQESARGNFPGPLPVVYCESSYSGENKPELSDLANAGVAGVLYTVLNGDKISSADEILNDSNVEASFQSAIESGLQLIPEVVVDSKVAWDEDMTQSLVDKLSEKCGSAPAAILLTLGVDVKEEGEEEESKDESEAETISLPKVPKGTPPILGSVRAVAGGGRIGQAVAACKDAGFNGVVLRCDCLPGYRMNPDLEFVGGFWGAAIGDLKSLKSKNFNFRSKVSLDRDIPLEWFNYQKNVMESGALGGSGPGANPLDEIDPDNGDYQGF
jgi:hypothetical protein